jgi:hypothetical protein
MIDVKMLGVGLAAAVLIDATIVRGVVLPAALALLGDRAWYLPSWLSWLPGRGLACESTPVPRAVQSAGDGRSAEQEQSAGTAPVLVPALTPRRPAAAPVR